MILAFNLADIVQIPFGWLMSFLYDFTNSYGWALILFAFLVKLILLPATAKGKKSTMKMSRLTPQIEAIKKKYEDDPQKQQDAMQKLYKEEGVSVGGGCLWSFLPLLVLIPLYTVVRQPITYMLHESAETAAKIVEVVREGLPTLFTMQNQAYEQMIAAPHIPEFVEQVKAILPELRPATLEGINFTFLGIDLASIPQFNIFGASWKWDWAHIGGFLIPILSAGGQLLSMLISQHMNNSLVTDEKGLQDKDMVKNSQSAQQSQMMMWISPIISLIFGFSMPGALSLYWFAQGIVTTVSDVYLTQKYRKIYDVEDAARLQKAMEEDAIEAEKEKIRAARRAANPDGITTNTSKKKQQQNKQREQEAAKAAAAREYAEKKGLVPENAPVKENTAPSGIADRPYCKGRAYDPNRYKS